MTDYQAPPLRFQPPGFQQPQQYQGIGQLPQTIGQSFDSVFNKVVQSRVIQQQMNQQQQQMDLQRGQAALQNAAFGGPDPVALGQSLNQNPSQGQAGQYTNPHLQQQFENFVNAQEAAYQFGIQRQMGEAQKVQAEAQKAGAEATQTQAQTNLITGGGEAGNGGPGNGGGSYIQNTADAVQSGLQSPDQALEGAGRAMGGAAKLALSAEFARRKLDLSALEAKFKFNQAIAQTNASPEVQTRIRVANALLPELDKLSGMADSTPQTSWQTINKYGLAIAAQRGDRGANALQTQVQLINRLQPTIEKASGSQMDKSELDLSPLSTAKTTPQLKDSINLVKGTLSGVRNALLAPATQPGTNQPSTVAATGQQPVIKTLKNGQQIKVLRGADGKWHEVT